MTHPLTVPPVLSTPETHIFEDPTPDITPARTERLGDQEVQDVYEVERTAMEIEQGGWRRIALQFPDEMLSDAPRVFERLEKELAQGHGPSTTKSTSVERDLLELDIAKPTTTPEAYSRRRLYILADTSYGACCVDEIAAEHVDADVVVHYGRSCLSPTARLPVIYIYTSHSLNIEPVLRVFEDTYPQKDTKVILMADVTYDNHIQEIHKQLRTIGYSNVFAPSTIHNPSSPLPNRTIPTGVQAGDDSLEDYSLFHISDPPRSLLLTLSSRLKSMYIYPTNTKSPRNALQAQTAQLLRRRYALITSLSTCSIFGILINTLSVKNYLPTISTIKARIAVAGKKSYTFVVGKVNAAKIANFSEIGGWVVIGCWESSLIESSEFFRPIITPFELELCLQNDDQRVWTGAWNSDFSSIMEGKSTVATESNKADVTSEENNGVEEDGDGDDLEESEPPEYDFRTGRYISHSRPMKAVPEKTTSAALTANNSANTIIKRANGDVATINGSASPGAEFLRTQRTWAGLGSDFEKHGEKDTPTRVEEGRSGVARGYTVGEDGEKR